ncbi:MAG: DUF4197 domain-containing protein [Hydrogenophaga sp.]|uniref:DUF4197 domain-containing protein n=1 Tax=Hydrogenophaga sp. TaxID=1904254 RepID=UPI001E0DC874|nr:DUF4197 domain-containing protein [Hydrogenophaga sp.]MBX3608265.1 DUF4197 domain-containing protein [Hydrogenophaga sp.]
MYRRQFQILIASSLGGLIVAAHRQAWALSIADLTDRDATNGIRTALEKGALAAVALLGKTDGFLGNPKVRIPLPGYLEDAAKFLRFAGQGKRVDELVTGMNRAAEQAVPLGKDLLVGAVKSMSVTDAKNILGGGDDSVTQFFAAKTREPLGEKFLPVVTQTTQKVGLARSYNRVAEKASGLGLVNPADANVERYVTGKSLDGLYTIIGDEERKIRQDPVGTGSAILKKVFGALK